MLESSYCTLPNRFYQRIHPEVFTDPAVVLYNLDLANDLGLSLNEDLEIARVFSGQQLLSGSQPIAQAYAGSQFGHFVPSLGDGRAHLLGDRGGKDIQLKGSGRTQFSRGGDGRCALGPAIREFLVSEGMHALGIPTTRALCVVTTGEEILRQDGVEPGAVITRVAESFIRVGSFQLFAFQRDRDALVTLLEYSINRHYPHLNGSNLSDRCLEFLKTVADRQGDLVAQWYGMGFIHGVMNTDNCSIAGITIDYGPCAFMDEFRWHKVFSSIDRGGRYAYGKQMSIVEWNILRLAECLLPLIHVDAEIASAKVQEALGEIFATFPKKVHQVFCQKLGFPQVNEEIETLISEFLQYLEAHSLDFTLSFFHLRECMDGESSYFSQSPRKTLLLEKWRALGPDPQLLIQNNPQLIPRNHQIASVIQSANQGDYEPLQALWCALKNPFHVPVKYQRFAEAPQPQQRVYQTFCGT